MGAWIEIMFCVSSFNFILVALYMGAWIEISSSSLKVFGLSVALYMGAWIEIIANGFNISLSLSHSIWVRGLKFCHIIHINNSSYVALYMGAWIEM